MLLAYKSKLAAQEVVTLAKETLASSKITEVAKTVATATITVREETTSVAVAETAVCGVGITTKGIMKPAQGAMATKTFGQST